MMSTVCSKHVESCK